MPWASCPTESPPSPPWSLVPSDPFQRPSSAAVNQQRALLIGLVVVGSESAGPQRPRSQMHRATISPPQVDNPSLLAETQSDCHSDCPPGAASHPLMQSLIHS